MSEDPDHERLREVRRAVLANRYARQGCAQTAKTIHSSLRIDDRSITLDAVETAIEYLAKKSWLTHTRDPVAAGVLYWDINGNGIDAYESNA